MNGKTAERQSRRQWTEEEQEIIKRFLLSRREVMPETIVAIQELSDERLSKWERNTIRYYRWYDAVIRHMLATLDLSEREPNAKSKQNGNNSKSNKGRRGNRVD